MTNPPEREGLLQGAGHDVSDALHRSTGSYELVIAAIAAGALGFWIDTVVGMRPLFTLIFAIAGFIGASYSIWLNYRTQMQTADTERTARRDGTSASGEATA